jgi:hypothetical protein
MCRILELSKYPLKKAHTSYQVQPVCDLTIIPSVDSKRLYMQYIRHKVHNFVILHTVYTLSLILSFTREFFLMSSIDLGVGVPPGL